MSGKPKYLTIEFWAGILSALALLAVTLGVASQEEVNTWVALLTGLIVAILPIVALITGYSNVRAARVTYGVLPTDEPGYMTLEFWMTLASTVVMVLVGLRVISQDEGNSWLGLLGPLVAAVLAIVAYIRGRLVVSEAGVRSLYIR